MYLKSLRMQGFKSFPEPTIIEFHPGITAIVGPNGSGKSNITDAIRWVLGEQSAKTLRGSRMEDVIFSGTETRRQLGFAEVTITFDNKDHHIPIDYETIEVTRRYYRSGDSEYLINKVQCRLKDIRELFLDTGIGRDGYSIIGQGKIDQILSDNSEDRRKVFDEAAGIVKYKMRKRDAERKLEKTEQNLIRINDIVQELNQRLIPLEKQSKKTKSHQKIVERMRNLDIGLTIHDIKRNQTELVKSEQISADFDQDLTAARELSKKLKNDYQKFENHLSAIDEHIEAKRLVQSEKNADLAELSEKRTINKERQRFLKIQIEADLKQETELQIEEQLLDSDLSLKQNQIDALEKDVAEISNSFKQEQSILKDKTDKFNQIESAIEDIRSDIDEKNSSLYSAQNSTISVGQEILYLNEQIDLIETELERNRSEHAIIIQRLADQEDLLESEQKKFKVTSADLSEARKIVELIRADLSKQDQIKQNITNEINNTHFRLQTLLELEANREGFHYAVKSIMKEAAKNPDFAHGIHGPLAELINAPEKYDKAIEVALGGALHNIVTSTKSDATRIIEWLRQTKSGRETFLPIDTIRSRYISDFDLKQIEEMRGFLGVASNKLSFPDKYMNIVEHLLGRVILADNLENALLLSAELENKYRIVTLKGDVVQVGGSMTGGENKKSSPGLLKRNRQIIEYKKRIDDLQHEKIKINKLLEEKTETLLIKGQVQSDLEDQYVEREKYLYKIETIVEQCKDQAAKLKQEIDQRLSGLAKSKLTINEATHKKLKAEDSLIETQQLKKQLQANLVELEKNKLSVSQTLKAMQEKVIQLNISLRTKEESLMNFSDIARKTKEDVSKQKNKKEKLAKQVKESEFELESLINLEKKYEEEYLTMNQVLSELLKNIHNKQQERIQIEKKQRQLFDEVEQQADLVSNLQIQLERSKQKTERLEQSILSSKNHIWENYETTYVQINPNDYPIENINHSRGILKDLRQEMKALGPINPNAITEYNEIAERHEFMVIQKEDIESSKNSLNSVIKDLDTAMSKQFLDNFAQINHNFKEVFSALFSGGEAELTLETDDPLQSGIQIKAQPPGKRLQNLSLLSGGERSLTAIALLLAIFKLRPAPFCVLDEVESALDETNIIRFTDYLKNYTDDSQFVLVTHRKGTMEASERLYGITMKERGVSKVLSLELTDADTVNEDERLVI